VDSGVKLSAGPARWPIVVEKLWTDKMGSLVSVVPLPVPALSWGTARQMGERKLTRMRRSSSGCRRRAPALAAEWSTTA